MDHDPQLPRHHRRTGHIGLQLERHRVLDPVHNDVAGTTPPPSTATTAAPTTATPTFAGFSMKRFCDAVGPLPQLSTRPNQTSSVPVLAVLPSYDPRRSVTKVKQIFGGLANTTIVEVPEIIDPLSQLTDCFYATANAFLAAPSAPLDASCLTAPAISTLA